LWRAMNEAPFAAISPRPADTAGAGSYRAIMMKALHRWALHRWALHS